MRQLILLMVCGALALTGSACTAVKGTMTYACDVTRIPLNTGYDHVNDNVLNLGDSDAKWIIIRDPDPSTTEPRPATAVLHSAWAQPQTGSQWISPQPAGTTTLTDAPATPGDTVYSYLYCFCLCDETESEVATIEGSVRADNEVTLYLNDVEILAQTPNNTFSTFEQPIPFSADNTHMRRGINCLRADVRNETYGLNPTGLNIVGTITKTSCCQGRTSRPNPGPGVGDPLGNVPTYGETN